MLRKDDPGPATVVRRYTCYTMCFPYGQAQGKGTHGQRIMCFLQDSHHLKWSESTLIQINNDLIGSNSISRSEFTAHVCIFGPLLSTCLTLFFFDTYSKIFLITFIEI